MEVVEAAVVAAVAAAMAAVVAVVVGKWERRHGLGKATYQLVQALAHRLTVRASCCLIGRTRRRFRRWVGSVGGGERQRTRRVLGERSSQQVHIL